MADDTNTPQSTLATASNDLDALDAMESWFARNAASAQQTDADANSAESTVDDNVVEAAPDEPAPDPVTVDDDDDDDLFAHLDQGAADAAPAKTEAAPSRDPVLEQLVEQNRMLMQLLQGQRTGNVSGQPAQAAADTTEVDPLGDDFVAQALAKRLGTDAVPTELLDAWREAYSLRAQSKAPGKAPGWDTPEAKAVVARAEDRARTLLARHQESGGLKRKVSELEQRLAKADAPRAYESAATEFESTFRAGTLDSAFPVAARLAKAGASKAMSRMFVDEVGADQYAGGQVRDEHYAQWMRAVEQRVGPIVQLMEQEPASIQRDLAMLKATNPALAEIVAPYAERLAKRPSKGAASGGGLAAAAKGAKATPPKIRQGSGGSVARSGDSSVKGHLIDMSEQDFLQLMRDRSRG